VNNIPTLKQHLRVEWDLEKEREKKRANAKMEKRKREEVDTERMEPQPASKRIRKDSPPDKTSEAIKFED